VKKETEGNRRRIFAAPLDRNEKVLVLAFCSFLMKADLGEAGQNLLIPRWQQQLVRGIKNRQKCGERAGRAETAGNRRQSQTATGVLAEQSVPGRLGFKMVSDSKSGRVF
jgi:hypothetical protein